jgi:ubiquinone/menaquinone biosynthesis C-methylase UbiE
MFGPVVGLMSLLVPACRLYQRLFPRTHAEAVRLSDLHARAASEDYLRAYFEHQSEKGRAMVARFAAVTREWEGGRILDFGCGAGGLTFALREHAREVVGIDLEADKLAFARDEAARRGLGGVEFICYDGGDVPLPAGSFDCVFCVDVIEHLMRPARAVREFRRLLRPGGLLLLSFGPPWCHPHGKHMWARLPGWWTHLLFPRAVVMEACGLPRRTTWEQLGMNRMTVGRFERVMRASGFAPLHTEYRIKSLLAPLRHVPVLRELFISEVVGVYRKPG